MIDRRKFLIGSGIGVVGTTLAPYITQAGTSANAPAGTAIQADQDIMGDLKFSTAEFKRRYDNIQAAMAKQGLDCLVITGTTDWYGAESANLNYVSGKQIRLEPFFVLFPQKGDPVYIFKKSVFLKRAPDLGNAPMATEPSPLKPGTGNAADFDPTVAQLITKLGYKKGTIGLVPARLTPATTVQAIEKQCPHAQIVDAEPLMIKLRRVKSAEEIRFLKRSGYMADVGVQALVQAIEPGITEHELVLAADNAMVMQGAKPGGFQLLKSGKWKDFGPGLAQGRMRKVEPGDLILNELTSNYKGYYTQLAVPVSLGEPDPQFQLLMKTCQAVIDAQLPLYKPGVDSAKIDKIGEAIAHDVSGGVFGTHFSLQTMDFEKSFMHPHSILEPGITYALMPWIHANRPGRFVGHAFGNTVVCTNDGALALNNSALDLVVI